MSVARDAISRYWQNHPTEATEKQELFLAGLKETGTVLHAAELADINRATAYEWRASNPAFRQAWDEILENVTDKVERSLYNQAVSEKNVVATIFYLKANRAKYRDRIQVDVGAAQREIEGRLDGVSSLNPTTSPAPCSTKEIIREALGVKRQPIPKTTDGDNLT